MSSSSSSPTSLTCTKLALWTIAAVLLQILGLSLFVLGFFPIKPALSGVSGVESFRFPTCDGGDHEEQIELSPDQRRSLYKEMSAVPPSFDRLVLMVVDGLPAEFVLGKAGQPPIKAMMESMPYTQSLLSNGTAIGCHAKAAPPTVTMPRLKAMVSGAVGGFLDVAFNFNTQALLDDNLLGQFYSIAWEMVMLGDETWIKLFPRLFTRHDGVSSFFVKDTIEVDHNVSRHLDAELATDDWSLLILHYLGLDHVGHIGGRNSILMFPKLEEMDEVVRKIHGNAVLDPRHGRTLLLVVSDHGMTDSGNHGGSSHEETDALALFIGLGSKVPDHPSATRNEVFQVDIAPTLALLFGVPIPRNNIGVLIAQTLTSLTEGQQLRALELNSWQLLRLLQVQLPGLLCGNSSCNGFSYVPSSEMSECKGNMEQKLCCLFFKSAALHNYWISRENQSLRSNSCSEFRDSVSAYYDFLKTASEWLSRTATDKPLDLLVLGTATMLLSCVMFLSILLWLCKMFHLREKQFLPSTDNYSYKWDLDELFVLVVMLILGFSMVSSSMVEEEQYIWHFMTSTLFLIFLRKSSQSIRGPNFLNVKGGRQYNYSQACSIIVVLICGRILRGWHQGGVNWVHLPDISKWLENAGPHVIKLVQIVAGILAISLSPVALYIDKSKRSFVLVLQVSYFMSGVLVLLHIVYYQNHTLAATNNSSILIIRMIYSMLITTVLMAVLGLPWAVPIVTSKIRSEAEPHLMHSFSIDHKIEYSMSRLRASVYLIGWTYAICWCLLQLLLQKPANAMPSVLLLLQVLASMLCFSTGSLHNKQWVEVATLYFLGMTGHFSLGNSNTLATIDVAGAFMGISNHSTVLSGILMFLITYASPLFCLLSLILYISTRDVNYILASQDTDLGYLLQMMISVPCVVPLSLNSVVLTTFTIILMLMRNHLFVWSVFSPKYLYVCATTVCVYVGVLLVAASGIYAFSVFFFRKKCSALVETAQ